MKRAIRNRARGQATIELALMLGVFVTVLTMGIFFADVGLVRLRLLQAHNTAMWDATKMRTHDFLRGRDPKRGKFFKPEQMREQYNGDRSRFFGDTMTENGTNLFSDLDGRKKHPERDFRSLFLNARGVSVVCENASLAPMPTTGAFKNVNASFELPDDSVDALTCRAEAKARPLNLPSSFLDSGEGGFFKEKLADFGSIRLCGFGRATRRGCTSTVPLLNEKFVLRGAQGGRGTREYGSEDSDCHYELGIGCHNQAYKRLAERTFDEYGRAQGDAATRLTRWAVGDDVLVSYQGGAREYNRQYFGDSHDFGLGENEFTLIHTGEYRPAHGSSQQGVGYWCTQDVDADGPGGYLQALWQTKPGHFGNEFCPVAFAATPARGPHKRAYQRRNFCFLGRDCEMPE